MNPVDRVRIVGDCQMAMLRSGWRMLEARVFAEGRWTWQVEAIRREQHILCRALSEPLAWLGALQQAELQDEEEKAVAESSRRSHSH